MHIKDARVTNPRNVLVQVPSWVARKWALKEGETLGVHISEDGEAIIIRPNKILTGSNVDKKSERMVGSTT